MKQYLFIQPIFICLLHTATGQNLRQPLTTFYPATTSYSTQHSDVFSFVNNQASLAGVKSTAAGVYSERRFLLAATSLHQAAVVMPSKMGNFGLVIKYAGFKNFNEKQIGVAYARSLGTIADIGAQFNYYDYRVPGYSGASAVNFELGSMLHLTSQLNAGIHVYNPMGGKFIKTGEQLAATYKFGLGYDASDKFYIGAEVVKAEDCPINVNAGMQYRFEKQFFARAGIATASSLAYAGFGVGWKNLRLDISGSYHPQLGWSPGLMLIIGDVAPGGEK